MSHLSNDCILLPKDNIQAIADSEGKSLMETTSEKQKAKKKSTVTMEQKLENFWEPLDVIGNALMESLWRDV